MTRYFCHSCKRIITTVTSDFTCPHCDKGFIEESTGRLEEEEEGEEDVIEDDDAWPAPLDFLDLFNWRPPPPASPSSSPSSSSSHQSRRSSSQSAGNNSRTSAGGSAVIENSTDNMLYSFISDLVLGLGGGQFGNNFPFLAGNLGDYVWGDGLDALVTQLMNNMDGTGPPPLDNDKLEKLPDGKVEQRHVDEKIQCAVCWDDFSLHESVKVLQCDHIFHPDCIMPWLKLHGTCPICRKDLNDDGKTMGERLAQAAAAAVELTTSRTEASESSSSRSNNYEMEFD